MGLRGDRPLGLGTGGARAIPSFIVYPEGGVPRLGLPPLKLEDICDDIAPPFGVGIKSWYTSKRRVEAIDNESLPDSHLFQLIEVDI